MKRSILLPFAFVLILSAHAQATEGDALIPIIGTSIKAPANVSMLKAYDVKFTADGIYSSTKTGIDIRTKHDSIVSMTLYRSNAIYGAYTHKLPKGLSFEMTNPQIEKMLGKPAVAYSNSGYCEYHFDTCVMTCWFEQGALRRVTLSRK